MTQIPDKLYFKIGEVATLLQLKTHVLRYWETEFTSLQPVRRKDVETALLIKELLYRQGFTIAGARKKIQADKQMGLPLPEHDSPESILVKIKTDLVQLRNYLSDRTSEE